MSAKFEFSDPENVIIYKLGSIEATLRELRDAQIQHNAQDQVFHADAEKRLKSLESSRNRAIGGVAAISSAFTLVINLMWKAFHA